jgi:dolichol-phosphate mannosyltransferase
MPEQHRYLRGLRTWVGFRQIGVPMERSARHAGRTKFSPLKLLKLASDGIFAFSVMPLRAAAVLGAGAIGIRWCFLSILCTRNSGTIRHRASRR